MQRKIDEEEAVQAIREPEERASEPERKRKTVTKETEQGKIKVVYCEDEEKILVITAIRKGRGM